VIKDDAVVDRVDGAPESIVLTLSGGTLANTSFTINVEDDDTEPRFGNDTIVFINESFTGAPNNFTEPPGWTEVLEIPEDYSTPTGNGQNQWGQFDNQIAIAFKPTATSTTGVAGTYNNLSVSESVIYKNATVDTRGLSNLRIRFDYTVQGEVDPNSTQPDQFPKLDYFELVYSLDNGVI
jgi:hypothetical protein